MFTGKLNSSKENSNYFDIIDSPSSKEKDCNLIMVPKLMINKSNKKTNFNELFEVAYNKLKKYENNKNYEFYHQIFYFYRKNKSNNLAAKIYTIFPNVNLEFRQIKNLSFSNTNLNKYLISSKYQIQEMSNSNNEDNYLSGFFTMSQNHRLIALKDDINEAGGINKSQSLKEIIFGIWMNLKDEKPISNKKTDLDFLFNKNKLLIYKQCFRFIELSSSIETIYSPSPEENVFILVLFYKGIQCHYEVKLNFNLNSNLSMNNNNINNNININNNSWLISKCKYELQEQAMKVPFDYDIKIEINNGTISSMNDFLNKKMGNKLQINNNINNNDMKKENIKENNELNGEKNNTSDMFNLSDFNGDSMNGEYKNKFNINNKSNINSANNNLINININNQNNKNEHEQNYLNKKQSQISHISHASTNAHSKKPSLSLSKNSKNNKEGNNMEQINVSFNKEEKEYKEEINLGDNFSESINQYTSIIKKNSENIKKLENQVNKMELEIKEIIKNLEEENNNNYKSKKEKKSKIIEKNTNNSDVSGIGDISINVPKIICKDLSMTNDI